MGVKKRITIIVNVLYVLILILFLLDSFNNPFEIKNQILKSFVYYGFLFGTPFILVWNFIFQRRIRRKMIAAILPFLMLIAIFAINPLKIIFASTTWKTQKIIYQSKDSKNKRIEFQMKDMGALGYDARHVEVSNFLNLFVLVKKIDKDSAYITDQWIKIDKDVNELGLKDYSQYQYY